MNDIPLIFVVGGARSGKSSFAESLVSRFPSPRHYLATSEVTDEEMRERIIKHQRQRIGLFDLTVEEPLHPGRVIAEAQDGMIHLDCLTVFLGNLFYHRGEKDSYEELDELYEALQNRKVPLTVVGNLVGEGLVPPDRMSRVYRDMHGWMNQRVASLSTTVVRMTCGIPEIIKGSL